MLAYIKHASLFSCFLFLCIITGCSKVYEAKFDNFLLAPISSVLNAPEYISGCTVEVKTSDKLDFNEYVAWCKCIEGWSWDEEYSYVGSWGQETSGAFSLPSGKGQMTIYSYDSKVVELTYDNWNIISGTVWQDNNVVCDFEGSLKGNDSERQMYYFSHGKITWSSGFPDFYKQKEVYTEGYQENCKDYKIITNIFYPSGVVSRKTVKSYSKEYEEEYEEGYYSMEIIEDVYYNKDGSEMTMADRLFDGHEKYVILPTGYRTGYAGDYYVILMPGDRGKTRGYGATIASYSSNLSRYIMDRTFEYQIEGDEITCDEFYYHLRYETDRVRNQRRRRLEIQENYDGGIAVVGEFTIDGMEADCYMVPTDKGYSDGLYTSIQNDYIKKR